MYYVYYLQSKTNRGQNYIGYTIDLKTRLKKHNNGLVQSTQPYRPWRLIFYEAYINKLDAKRREQYLKTTKGRKVLRLMLQNSIKYE